jgi:hypothetical protein
MRSDSNLEKTEFVVRIPLMGFENNCDYRSGLKYFDNGGLLTIQTIMMENICNELPDMYAIIACIGNCLAGASAISHDFFNFNVSVSSSVGGLRATA